MQPDVSETIKFFKLLFGENPPQLCFQIFAERTDIFIHGEWRYTTLRDGVNWLTEVNNRQAGIFFVVNLGDRRGRTADNITQVRALFVDLDGQPYEPVVNSAVPPHIVVESSPGRYHCYWKINDCALNMFTPIQKALAAKFLGDSSVCDLCRVMRVPGFYHQKGQPFMTRVIATPNADPIMTNDLVEKLGLFLPAPTEKLQPSSFLDRIESVIPQGQRHEAMLTAAARLRNGGLIDQMLFDSLWGWNLKYCAPPLPESEVRRICADYSKKNGMPLVSSLARGKTTASDHGVTLANLKREVKIISWHELQHTEMPQLQWVIDEILPQGLTVCVGKPKVGKSWLTMGLSYCVSKSIPALGNNLFQTHTGDTLTLALEDPPRRFKDRLKKVRCGENAESTSYVVDYWPNGAEGIELLDQWLENANHPRLVVIDTFQKVRAPRERGGDSVYERDYIETATFQRLAIKHSCAIILVHHPRKGESEDLVDTINGSNGIAGAADSLWFLQRTDAEKGRMTATLTITGRDVWDRVIPMEWHSIDGRWRELITPEA